MFAWARASTLSTDAGGWNERDERGEEGRENAMNGAADGGRQTSVGVAAGQRLTKASIYLGSILVPYMAIAAVSLA